MTKNMLDTEDRGECPTVFFSVYAAVIPAIPDVLRNGAQIDYQQNWKGRPYDGYVFAAPVTFAGNTVYVAAVVKRTSKNTLYLHEVVDSDGNIIKIDDGIRANPTSLAANGDAGAQIPSSVLCIPQSPDSVNRNVSANIKCMVFSVTASGAFLPTRTFDQG